MGENNFQYTMIDLCAGIGGIRRGFELTGRFNNVLSAEIDKYACRTYEHLFGENPKNDVMSNEFLEKVLNTDFDVVCAGFPCQAFSSVGLQEGFSNKDKGTVFFHIARIIKRKRPKAVFLENVQNLVRHNNRKTFWTIISKLEDELDYHVIGVVRDEEGCISYDWHDFVRNTRNFGIPQNRPRVYIVAFDRKRYGEESIAALNLALPLGRDELVYDDLNGLLEMGAADRFYLSSGLLETLEKHRARHKSKGNGFGCKVVNEPSIEHPVANTIMATGGSGKERNLVYDPQDGIAGKVLPSKRSPLNDKGIRFMTPREWGKLQGFINYGFLDEDGIDGFSFPEGISVGQQYKQFGNAVSIPVVRTMAELVAQSLDEFENIEEI
jgi:DNA (cytosine-5)-methyltransferase 1